MAENDVEPVEPEPTPAVDKSQYVVVPDAEALAKASGGRKAKPAKGPLKPESLSTDYVVVTDPATASEPAEPTTPTAVQSTTQTEVLPEAAAVPAATATPTETSPQVVYVAAPVPPKRAGNRAFGVLIAIAATIIFAVLFAFAVLLILRGIRGYATMSMLANYGYWIPVGVFLIAFLIVVLVINRAGWWAHIIGSFLVGAAVYLAGALLITSVSVFGLHQVATVQAALVSPTAVAAAIIAREVALWAGVIVSFRGKRVVVRNREARAAFDSEQAPNA
jgi:hypothetical protein